MRKMQATTSPTHLVTRWVCENARDVDADLICCRLQHHVPTSHEVGMYPLLTKWVCAKTRDVDAHRICCRLQHQLPTSDEVGMRENLTRTRIALGSLHINV
jgi:hypothetical protein